MAKEPTDPPIRKTVSLPASMWHFIAEFRAAECIGTEGDALRRLLLQAIRAETKKRTPPPRRATTNPREEREDGE